VYADQRRGGDAGVSLITMEVAVLKSRLTVKMHSRGASRGKGT